MGGWVVVGSEKIDINAILNSFFFLFFLNFSDRVFPPPLELEVGVELGKKNSNKHPHLNLLEIRHRDSVHLMEDDLRLKMTCDDLDSNPLIKDRQILVEDTL